MSYSEFSTAALPSHQQFDAWCGWFQPTFDVRPQEPVAGGFAAESRSWVLDKMTLSRVNAPAIEAVRTPVLVRRNPVDHWVLTIGKRTTWLGAGGQVTEIPGGVPFIVSLGSEMSSRRDRDERVQLYFPRDHFPGIGTLLEGRSGQVLHGPLGQLLADYIGLLDRRIAGLRPEELSRLSGAVRAMLEACLAPTGDRIAIAGAQIDRTRLERVRQIVRRNLHNPALSPAMLCRQVGMSRSQLYRLLETEGGIAHFIRRLRLIESHTLLSQAGFTATIGDIAETLCFTDASSFSRAFRREFGMSPRDVRVAAGPGGKPDQPGATSASARNLTLRSVDGFTRGI